MVKCGRGLILVWIQLILVLVTSSSGIHEDDDGDADGDGGDRPGQTYLQQNDGAHSNFNNDNNHNNRHSDGQPVGLSPPVGNLATIADITVNGSCGETGAETYCKLVEHVHLRARPSQCDVCDARSHDRNKRHPIQYATDGSSRWWQSPSLQNGRKYEWITITINLKQVYQVAYIVIKAANSPRPGNWILERSLDGQNYSPWQYYAVSDEECWTRYGIPATADKPVFVSDDQVICTSYYSKITPFEGGEIHTSLVNGRPGAVSGPSETLIKFTMAHYIRLRFQKIRTLYADLIHGGGGDDSSVDKSVMRRYFYSIKDIAIGGHCVCFGHSNECLTDEPDVDGGVREKCSCKHNTCGSRCEACCPLFNQVRWAVGNSTSSSSCEPCQCHGRAGSCYYDEKVAAGRRSVNSFGNYDGGGVCVDCREFTTGINCEKCIQGYYRPNHISIDQPNPCRRCECNLIGTIGHCYTDQDPVTAGSRMLNYGDCLCKEGFAGRKCDQCAAGWHGFPNCERCACDMAGVADNGCDGQCVCKQNVEGRFCSTCKPGYYNLDKNNPNGCTQCFCNGLTDKCVPSNTSITRVQNGNIWFVSDLHATRVLPAQKSGQTFHISNEEFHGFNLYFWYGNGSFAGRHLDSYGLRLVFHITWVQARGDTSGRVLREFDVIIRGRSSMLAYSHEFHEGTNATISIVLDEIHCLVLPDMDNNIIQRNELLRSGNPCTKHDVMEVLFDIKMILLRTKHRTDQIEGMLHEAYIEKAAGPGEGVDVDGSSSSIELCSCPPGYTGSSCEACGYGYRELSTDTWLTRCYKCECSGHARSCDIDGACWPCDHNTTGDHCQYCQDGFYGYAQSGLTAACKVCECPLAVASNNFSPTCALDGNNYKCTACRVGYEGAFCERCSNGFYGNPTSPGDTCKPCACNAEGVAVAAQPQDSDSSSQNICDQLTGECFNCSGNTIGWKCDECRQGYFGNPLNGSCSPCNCNKFGSIGLDCHPETGQCICGDDFHGKKCDECIEGHGSVEEDCPVCSCDGRGSDNMLCNPVNGQCDCKPGVGGRYCNRCLDLHYNFSRNGCTGCECDLNGSDSPICNLNTGQCNCLPHVKNRQCNECEVGYWNINSGIGCTNKCDCNALGADGSLCEPFSGQCSCRPGVSGRCCDKCVDNYYGFSSYGCQRCDPCTKFGNVCDKRSGRCTCPPNTEGDSCEKCMIGYWGYALESGCKECNCSQLGSVSQQCSLVTGACTCKEGYNGDKCTGCKFGYHNYPKCSPCSCDPAGTIESYCNGDGECSCAETGQCRCKDNVIGQKCSRCDTGTYDLQKANPEGCTECFCFGRTNKCSQGYFQWERLTLPSERRIEPMWNSKFRLKLVNNLIVIPENGNDVLMESEISFGAPLYWPLPHIFTGDKVLSYGGYLRFRVTSEGGSTIFPFQVLESYPLVQIQGNHKLILEHFVQKESPSGYYEIKLHEDFWQLKNFNSPLGTGVVTKEIMMVALQNLQSILIRGTSRPEIHSATLFNVSLDIAVPSSQNKRTAFGIEICDCPPEYNSTSCQNPKLGYYRWYKNEYITSTVIIDLIGEAKLCECNGRSLLCDTETGNCLNCSGNAGGAHCEECAAGYYGHPSSQCHACPCPTIRSNHAISCAQLSVPGPFSCRCQPGYTGRLCERCDYGHYGNATAVAGSCRPCQCNDFGSASDECDERSGQCNCRAGISGRDCTKCSYRHVLIGKTCTSCQDSCTGVLMETVDGLMLSLRSGPQSPEASTNVSVDAVWARLNSMDEQWRTLSATFLGFNILTNELLLNNYKDLYESFRPTVGKSCNNSEQFQANAHGANSKVQALLDAIHDVRNSTAQSVVLLDNFTHGKIKPVQSNVSIEREVSSVLNQMETVEFSDAVQKVKLENEEAMKILQFISNYVWTFEDFKEDADKIRDRLDDLRHHMSVGQKNQAQADGILYTANENYLGIKTNIDAINSAMANMLDTRNDSEDKLNRGPNIIQEMNQVLMMVEDLLLDVRNWTKEVEIRENTLFDLVPLYRVRYAQPAFDHVKLLQQKSTNLQGLIYAATFNGSERLQGLAHVTQIQTMVNEADVLVEKTTRVGEDTRNYIHKYLSKDELDLTEQDSLGLIQDAELFLEIVKASIQNNLDVCKGAMSNAEGNLRNVKLSVESVQLALDKLNQDHKFDELTTPIETAKRLLDEIAMQAMTIETEIKRRIGGTSISGTVNLEDVQTIEEEIRFKLTQVDSKWNHIKSVFELLKRKHVSTDSKLKYLRALILQSRHRADSVPVSLGPDETGICFRLFKTPGLSVTTTINFKFAPIRGSDSLLFFWPSSINEDFISIEMVNLQIKVSWNLGSGLHTILYPKKLSPDLESETTSPTSWVTISLERIGSSVSIHVETPDGPNDIVSYQGSDEESTLLDLAPNDFVHIGGFSKEKRPGLVSNGLSGCLHNLQINGRLIGLWNFVGNEGCSPCMECPSTESAGGSANSDYYLDGRRSYSSLSRLQSQTFNSRTIEISIEFQTSSEAGLLFLTVNDSVGQSVVLELVKGQILFSIQHGWNDTADRISVRSNRTQLNAGKWVQLHAIWVFQFGTQIIQLTIGKVDRYTEQRASTNSALALQLYNAVYHLGGISPTFQLRSDSAGIPSWNGFSAKPSYRGCLKNALIDGTTYDLVSGQHHGIESGCKGRNTYSISFAGNGFAEYQTQLLDGKDVHFGFSFRTTYPSGILMMLTAIQDKSTEINIHPYLIVYLENGSILVQIGTLVDSMIIGNQTVDGSNELDVVDGNRYDDGLIHAFRMSRRNRKIKIYMDDELIQEDRAPKKFPTMTTSATHRLFFGGINLEREEYLVVETQIPKNRFSGCIEYFFIGNELLPFNDPVTFQNHVIGPCATSPLSEIVHSYGRLSTSLGDRRPAGDLLRSLNDETTRHCSTYDEDGVQFSNSSGSYGAITLQANALKQKFNLTFSFKTANANGVFVYGVSKKHHGNSSTTATATASCILIYLNNGILSMKLYGNRPQELICSTINRLNDGSWHQISVIKSDNKIYIFMDSSFQTNCEYLTTKIKSIHKLYVGGIPAQLRTEPSNCLSNLDEDTIPLLPLDGCMKHIIINSFQYTFKSQTVALHSVQSCLETGSRNLVLNSSSSSSSSSNSTSRNC